MGRRALPKLDPTIDLSRHLRTFDELPAPWDAAALFGRTAPLEVEVGTGKGLFLQNAAAGTPEHDFMGVEVAHKYARYSASRLAKRGLANAVMVDGDGLRLFRELLPAESLTAVHVYFPDPWWKARHHKRRVMTGAFIADIARTLQTGGKLHFWTDVEEYFNATLELLANCGALAGPLDVPERPAEHDLDFRTHFERRMRLHGESVYRSEYEKR